MRLSVHFTLFHKIRIYPIYWNTLTPYHTCPKIENKVYFTICRYVYRSAKWVANRQTLIRCLIMLCLICVYTFCQGRYVPILWIIMVQSTLVISNSMGLSEILRDIRSSTYQVCRIEEKIIWLTTFNKLIGNWTFEVRDILKNIVEKKRNCSLGAISPLFYNIFHLLLGFHV